MLTQRRARAWGLKPQVLFLDEPTASLDPAATLAVEAFFDRIYQADTKTSMTTHDSALLKNPRTAG